MLHYFILREYFCLNMSSVEETKKTVYKYFQTKLIKTKFCVFPQKKFCAFISINSFYSMQDSDWLLEGLRRLKYLTYWSTSAFLPSQSLWVKGASMPYRLCLISWVSNCFTFLLFYPFLSQKQGDLFLFKNFFSTVPRKVAT